MFPACSSLVDFCSVIHLRLPITHFTNATPAIAPRKSLFQKPTTRSLIHLSRVGLETLEDSVVRLRPHQAISRLTDLEKIRLIFVAITFSTNFPCNRIFFWRRVGMKLHGDVGESSSPGGVWLNYFASNRSYMVGVEYVLPRYPSISSREAGSLMGDNSVISSVTMIPDDPGLSRITLDLRTTLEYCRLS